MKHRILTAFLLGATTALSLAPVSSHAQSYQYRAAFSPRELDALTAPIALYPDHLLANILMAATYPMEVRDAADWLSSSYNASLRGLDLEDALNDINWDPSVKSLVPVPGLLQMMANKMDWTERLGDAFIGTEGEVMDSVQRMRQQAYDRGSLRSNSYQRVVLDGDLILIEPASQDSFYFRVYDPVDVYGTWRYPEYPAYYLPPPVGYGIGSSFVYGFTVPIYRPYWGWNRWDWRNHRINIDRGRWDRFHPPGRNPGNWNNGGVWRHDSGRRANGPRPGEWRQRPVGGDRPVGNPPGRVGGRDRDDRNGGNRDRGDRRGQQPQLANPQGLPDSSPALRYGLRGGGRAAVNQPAPNATPQPNADNRRDERRGNRSDDNNRRGGGRAQFQQPQSAAPTPTPTPPPQAQQRRERGNGDAGGRGQGRGGEGGFRNRAENTAAPVPQQQQQQFAQPRQQTPPPQPQPQAQQQPPQQGLPDSSPALRCGLRGCGEGRP